MAFQDLFENSGSRVNLAPIVEYTSADGFDQGMVGFHLRALIEFMQCLFITLLIHENARAIVTGHHALVWIKPDHAVKTAQGALIFAIQPSQHSSHKMYSNIVWIF